MNVHNSIIDHIFDKMILRYVYVLEFPSEMF